MPLQRLRAPIIAAALAGGAMGALACGSFSGDVHDNVDPLDGGADGTAPSEAGTDGTSPPVDGAPATSTVVLAKGYMSLSAIVATDATVYFVDQATGAVHSTSIDGGTVTTLSPGGGAPTSLALVGNELFWNDGGMQKLNRMSTAGGTVTSISYVAGKIPKVVAGGPPGLVVLTENGNALGDVQQYDLTYVPKSSVASRPNPYSVAIQGSDIYWTESAGQTVAKGHFGDATRTVVSSSAEDSDAESIAADAKGVYWACPGQKSVRASLGGAPAKTLATGEDTPTSVAADGTSVYWISAPGKVRRFRAVDQPIVTVAEGFVSLAKLNFRALAVTSKYVVWLTDDGNVLRAEK
jgi:sugar lactone lactonase YvrE